MAKFGAITQCAGPSPNAPRSISTSASSSPLVPTTAWMPCIASHGTVVRAAAATVKSTTTSHRASANARRSALIATPERSWPAGVRPTAATSSSPGSSAIAAHAAVPMRPPAPQTPTRMGCTC